MKKGKRGFTLVEVAIFLAITGVLFLGVTAGVQTSVYQQRRNDSVQNFIEFLRGVYSEVENVQNDVPGGRSDKAIYGKLVTFGEDANLAKEDVSGEGKIFSYTVTGDAKNSSENNILDALAELNVNVFQSGGLVGYASEYVPKWGATINPPCNGSDCSYEPLVGALLVVRHPSSGTVWTYYRSGKLNVNSVAGNAGAQPLINAADGEFLSGFSADNDVDFCVNPSGEDNAKDRTDVRIVAGARNASGIEQVPDYAGKCGANY